MIPSNRLNNFRPVPDVCLSLHCGIGAGEIVGLFVGGVRALWEFFVAGEPIEVHLLMTLL
jgi:hypothetical protein